MADGGGQEKTEKPTPRRLQEARKKGQIAKSMDVNTAVVLAAAILILKFQITGMGDRLKAIAERSFSELPREDFTTSSLYALALDLGAQFFQIVAPTITILLVAGLIANYLQVGVLFTADPIKPQFNKINPISGFKRIVSRRSAVEVLKALVKMTVVGIVVYQAITEKYHMLAATVLMDKVGVGILFAQTAWEICWRSVLVLMIFGLLDYFYQRWEHEKGLKMTRQEIKDESKQSEGDPLVKGRIRRTQREAARRRMMSEVPKATVVITNPTHYAIALKYDRENMAAPKVVAKGVDLIAQRIKALAAEADVPMVENRPLAQALYKKAEIDEEIPEDLYAAVAEILVMVQRVNKKKSAV